MNVSNINNLQKIPMLRTPVFRDIEVAGQTVRVYKPKARQAVIVATRLAESFGETILRVFASPDEDVEVVGSKLSADGLKNILAAGMMPEAIKRLRELGIELGADHMFWYFEQLLAGNVELMGCRLESIDDFDEAQFGFEELIRVLWCAIELAIYPTSGDPSTASGSSAPGPAEENKAQTQPVPRPDVAMSKGGQSVPMSASRG